MSSRQTLKRPSARASKGKPRALDLGDLGDRVGYFVRRFQIWIFKEFGKEFVGLKLRPGEYSVLVVIGANPGASQSRVAATLGIERARLVRVLHHMQKQGLTQRLKSKSDRRSHSVHLTEAGYELLERTKKLAERHEQVVAQRIGPAQRKMIIEMLRDFG